jgi:YD repeat-containing protein
VTGHKDSPDGSGDFEYVRDIGYDEFGQRAELEYGNGVKTEYTYNPERRWLERIVTTGGTGSLRARRAVSGRWGRGTGTT